jgi:hypothetical protein
MLYQLFYVASTVPIKSAICVALLRITNIRTHRIILYSIIVLSLIAAITTDVAVLAQCRPIAATWNPALGKCAPSSVITGVSYFISASAIVTDWACAILPVFILWDVQMKLRIKASVAVVLALGVVYASDSNHRRPVDADITTVPHRQQLLGSHIFSSMEVLMTISMGLQIWRFGQ